MRRDAEILRHLKMLDKNGSWFKQVKTMKMIKKLDQLHRVLKIPIEYKANLEGMEEISNNSMLLTLATG